MPFTLREDIKSYINSGLLRTFLKERKLDSIGNKSNLIRNIELAVENGHLEEKKLNDFVQEQLWYGANKHHYFIELDYEQVELFSNEEDLKKYLESKNKEIFNKIDEINLPENVTLSRLEYEVNSQSNQVERIYVGYIEKNFLFKYSGNQAVFEPINTYICCELDLEKHLLLIRLRSRTNVKSSEIAQDKSISLNSLAKKYMERIKTDFDVEYLGDRSERMKNTLFKINRDLTAFVESKFQPTILIHQDFINDFTTDIASRLGLPSDLSPINLKERVFGLLERALVALNKSAVESYEEGKIGYVNRFDFRDDRGGRVNARTEEKNQPIQTSDIFFDTRETINEVQLLNSLAVTWFKLKEDVPNLAYVEEELEGEEIEEAVEISDTESKMKVFKLRTRITTYQGFYKIEFINYLLKEDFNHVLSIIDSFE